MAIKPRIVLEKQISKPGFGDLCALNKRDLYRKNQKIIVVEKLENNRDEDPYTVKTTNGYKTGLKYRQPNYSCPQAWFSETSNLRILDECIKFFMHAVVDSM